MTNSVLNFRNIESIFSDYGDATLPFIFHHYLDPKSKPGFRVTNDVGYIVTHGDRQLMFVQLDPVIYDADSDGERYWEKNIIGIYECESIDASHVKVTTALQVRASVNGNIVFDIAHEYLNSTKSLEVLLITHSDDLRPLIDSNDCFLNSNFNHLVSLVECV